MEHLNYPADVLGDREGATLANEESRAYLQSRVGLFAAVACLLVGAHYVAINSLRSFGGKPLSDWVNVTAATHLTTFATLLAFAAILRLRRFGVPVLAALDAAVVLCFVAGLTLLGYSARDSWAPEMVVMVGGTLALVARAMLVPSTAARTLGLGVVGGAIMIAGIFFISRAQTANHSPLYYAAVASSWAALSVAASVIASRILYGLRQQVHAAQALGQYVLGDKIGEGAMGVVYRAQHALLKRPTAVKLLRPELAKKRTVERFRREILLTARLEHPSTVAVYDCGQTREGALYYAMELLDGVDLHTMVLVHGPLEPERVVDILRQACGSLAEAHAAGLIHRDVKPGNMMLCRRGGAFDVLKMLDFGLVKESEGERVSADVSTETQIVGTPLFMAPEAIRAPEKVDARTDLYALGACAYFLLTGRHAFAGEEREEVFQRQLDEAPEPPSAYCDSAIPPMLDGLILACLAKKQEDRPASAQQLADALAEIRFDAPWTQARARTWWNEHRPQPGPEAQNASTTMMDPPRILAPDPHAATEPAVGSTMRSALPGRD
ncbi:MAG: protein kinase [Polyangiaceae bacterium]